MTQPDAKNPDAQSGDDDLLAIRSLLSQHQPDALPQAAPAPQRPSAPALETAPPVRPQQQTVPAQPPRANAVAAAPALMSPPPDNTADLISHIVTSQPETEKTPSSTKVALMRITAPLRGYRPTTKHVLWSIVALIFVLRPVLVISLSVMISLMLLGAFIAIGADTFWRRVLALITWIGHRNPEKALRLRARLDAFAMRWDEVLDRAPDGWVDALYMPDMRELAEADDRHSAAMSARLDRLRDDAAT